MVNPLDGCFAKLDRVDADLIELEAKAREFCKATHRLESEYDASAGEIVFRAVEVQSVPLELSVITGLILYGLRSAMDNLAWQLVLANGQTPQKPEFPIYTTQAGFQRDAPRKIKGIDHKALVVLEALQPYHAPNPELHSLWLIHELNNKDKHRLLILAQIGRLRANITTSIILDRPRPLGDGWFGAFGDAGSASLDRSGFVLSEGEEIARVKWGGDTSMSAPEILSSFEAGLSFGLGLVEHRPLVGIIKFLRNFVREQVFASPGLLDFIS